MIRVLLVDDDALVRAGLRLMLGGAADIEVVAEAADGSEVLELVAAHSPDLVLMDIRMPTMDGLAATRALAGRPGAPQVVMLTTFQADGYVLSALRAGAAGFLLKDTPPRDIVDAVRKVVAGEPALSPSVIQQLITRVAGEPEATDPADATQTMPASSPATSPPASAAPAGAPPLPGAAHGRWQPAESLRLLGERERQVALAIGRGLTNAEIAAELLMSVPTVKSHVSSVLTKLGVTNRVQIALAVHHISARTDPGASADPPSNPARR